MAAGELVRSGGTARLERAVAYFICEAQDSTARVASSGSAMKCTKKKLRISAGIQDVVGDEGMRNMKWCGF